MTKSATIDRAKSVRSFIQTTIRTKRRLADGASAEKIETKRERQYADEAGPYVVFA